MNPLIYFCLQQSFMLSQEHYYGNDEEHKLWHNGKTNHRNSQLRQEWKVGENLK